MEKKIFMKSDGRRGVPRLARVMTAIVMMFTLAVSGTWADPNNIPVSGVSLDVTEGVVTVDGAVLALTATVEPENATDQTVTWSVTEGTDKVELYANKACTQAVGAEAIAVGTIYVKAKAVGQSTITVTTTDSDKTASCALTVKDTYSVKMMEGTEAGWTIDPTEAKPGMTVTATYSGNRRVKSLKAMVMAVDPAGNATDLSTLTANYEAQDGETLTGTLSGIYKITIANGATVTLDGVTINGTTDDNSLWAGLTCLGDATIILSGENTVTGFHQKYPGIYVPENKTVTIQGNGSLAASSNGTGAGIGGGNGIACGNITIAGGNITATGGSMSAGIGGAKASCGNISITGGNITATGGYGSAGIGSGGGAIGCSCGNISITGGTVNATGGSRAAGIGSGGAADCGAVTITMGVSSVTATKGSNAPYSIGAGYGGLCGTVTIGGTVYENGISDSPYTYPVPL